MLKKLIHRPIGVMMTFLALVIFGVLAMWNLPISLLPDMDSPQITIRLQSSGNTPLQWEENVMNRLRALLRPTLGLEDLESIAEMGEAQVNLDFAQQTSMDMAFLEVNEKIDRFYSENNLLLDERPQVIRRNSSDVPIMRIQVIPDSVLTLTEASRLTEKVISRRLERLEGVSIIDISGLQQAVINLLPRQEELLRHDLDHTDLARAINRANRKLNSVQVASGNYRYNLEVDARITNLEELKNISVPVAEDIYLPISYFSEVTYAPITPDGYHLFNDRPGLVLNVHKQMGARITPLVESLQQEVDALRSDYPGLDFQITHDQSKWLSTSLQNLTQSLLYGGLAAAFLIFLFLGNWRAGTIMAANLPVTLILSFLFFFLLDLSLNLITLAGLALGVGMLIDNTIIVIDNIEQKRNEISDVSEATYHGTQEVMSALISSVLTTLAVFIPLMFFGGTAGALFYDQAISIGVILTVSLLVSFVFTPVLYTLIEKGNLKNESPLMLTFRTGYKKHFNWIYQRKWTALVLLFILPIISGILVMNMSFQGLPEIHQNDWQLIIKWPDNTMPSENRKRTVQTARLLEDVYQYYEADVAATDFILSGKRQSQNETVIYFHLERPVRELSWRQQLANRIRTVHPQANVHISPAPNIFDYIFARDAPYFEIRLRNVSEAGLIPPDVVADLSKLIPEITITGSRGFEYARSFQLVSKGDHLFSSGITRERMRAEIDRFWGKTAISYLRDPGERTAIYFAKDSSRYSEIINTSLIQNEQGDYIPLSELVEIREDEILAALPSDKFGIYHGIETERALDKNEQSKIIDWANDRNYQVSFAGTYFTDKAQLISLTHILGISLLLLYFILCAQFESFIQPIIVLLMVPIGICGSVLLLYLAGGTINLMAGIGIIIVSGIMVNDSILKIDTYNRRLKEVSIGSEQVIKMVGELRLKPILMTTFTTVLAILPILFSSGLGADLQYSMVIATIGGLLAGTYASLFILPVFYRWTL